MCLPPGVCKLYSIADNCCLKSSAQRSDYYLNPVILNRAFQCSAEWELGTCMRNLKFWKILAVSVSSLVAVNVRNEGGRKKKDKQMFFYKSIYLDNLFILQEFINPTLIFLTFFKRQFGMYLIYLTNPSRDSPGVLVKQFYNRFGDFERYINHWAWRNVGRWEK